MNNLNEIARRHVQDHWKDAVFVVLAVLLMALSIGSLTKKAAGRAPAHEWALSVSESNLEIVR